MARAMRWVGGVGGVVLLLLGGAVAVLVGPGSVVRLPPHPVTGGSPLIVTEPSLLGYRGTTAHVTARASSGSVFLGAGHPVDVTDYVAGASALRIQAVQATGVVTGTTTGDAKVATPIDPQKLTIWTVRTQGSGKQELAVALTGSPVEVLVLSPKGSTVTLGMGATLPGLFALALVVAVVGLVMAVLALAFGRHARRRRASATPPPTLGTASGAAPAPTSPTSSGPAPVGRTALRRSRPVIGAALVAAGLGACVSVPQPVAYGTGPITKVGLTSADTAAMLTSYNTRNNAAIAALAKSYSLSGWDAVDTGPVLAFDRFGSLLHHNQGKTESPQALTIASVATWSNAFSAYPLVAFVRTTRASATTGATKATTPRAALTVFTRASAASDWKMESDVDLETGAPAAGPVQPTVTSADVTSAQTGEDAVVAYLEKGSAVSLAPSPYLVETRKEFSVPDASAHELSRTTSCQSATPRPERSRRTVRTASGLMTMMTLRCTSTIQAQDGYSLNWQAAFAKTLGTTTDQQSQITRVYLVTVAVRQPSVGKTVVMGVNYGYVRPDDADALFSAGG